MARPIENQIKRFFAKVYITKSCWIWMGGVERGGYGRFFSYDKFNNITAHRFSYELFYKIKIPYDKHLDHLCKITRCVNPNHLEIVTPKENVLRSNGLASINAQKTHCKRGHPLSGDNLYINPQKARVCRKCSRLTQKRYNDNRYKISK